MYQVIGPLKSRTMRVLWALEEMGLPYEHIPESPRSEMVRGLNPSGKVPVLVTEGETLTDSTAIITYLADKHGLLTHPAGTIPRAKQDGLMHMILDELDAILWTAARHSFILPEDMRIPAIKESLRWEFAHSISRLGDRIEGPFLMGDTMTIADIVGSHCLNWASGIRFEIVPDSVRAYQKRICERPAFQRLTAA